MTTELTQTTFSHPACDTLAAALGNYQQSAQDLDGYRGKVARAQADQDDALSSLSLSEDQAASKISKAQALKAVFQARVEHREQELARLTSELEAAYQPANREFTGLLNAEGDRRKALVNDRVIQALEVDEQLTIFESASLPQTTETLLTFAKPVRVISSLKPTMYWGKPGDGAAISTAAGALLENLKKFKELTS
jgi:hypothetical protein